MKQDKKDEKWGLWHIGHTSHYMVRSHTDMEEGERMRLLLPSIFSGS